MSTDQWIVLATAIGAMAAFASERVPAEIVAVIVLCVLAGTGVLAGHDALSGFSSEAVIAVGAMFVLSSALEASGALRFVGQVFSRVATSRTRFRAVLMPVTGLLSAFMNNTAVVAILMPTVIRIAKERGWSTQRFLIPLSFSSQFGGVCTLVGTSTNLLVQSLAVESGRQGFTMFEFTTLGLVTLAAGSVYLLVFSPLLLPERSGVEPELLFELDDFVTELVVVGASLAGRALGSLELPQKMGLTPIELMRDGEHFWRPEAMRLRLGDVIRVSGAVRNLASLDERSGLKLRPAQQPGQALAEDRHRRLLQAMVPAQSGVVGHTPVEIGLAERYNAVLIAIRRHGSPVSRNLEDMRFEVGDVALLISTREGAADLQGTRDFVVLREELHGVATTGHPILPIAVIASVVLVAAMGWLPLYLSALLGCVVLLLAKSLTSTQALESVQWRVLFLIAGMLPLGIAIEKTGLAGLGVNAYLRFGGSASPTVSLWVLYLLTAIATEFLSNSAAAALLVPVAFSLSSHFGIEAKPFLIAIAFAASSSFSTPMGYQTNTMVYDAGNYRFLDFVRIGLPLNVLFWIIACVCIPWFFPFSPAAP